jgi:hypothetical protein
VTETTGDGIVRHRGEGTTTSLFGDTAEVLSRVAAARRHPSEASAWAGYQIGSSGREASLATDRETRDDALLVSVVDDVDHVPVWGAHEEPADAPRFVGQRMNDLVAAALRFRVGLVNVAPGVH